MRRRPFLFCHTGRPSEAGRADLAETIGDDKVAELLGRTLEEEKATEAHLHKLSMQMNPNAPT